MSYRKNGYIALLTAVILTAILTATAFAVGTSTFLARSDVLEHQQYLQAQHYARSCVYVALYALAKDYSYQPETAGAVVSLSPHTTCVIHSVHRGSTEVLIRTSAKIHRTRSTIEARATATSTAAVPILTSWKELYSI
ncbi:MAG: hypothetical protein AB202_01210 [Parcubacteria bacterium C7867-007]|nr:MAG: hypothetical protein AB202_01210 [Parcubacteria bacterium C7867-007]